MNKQEIYDDLRAHGMKFEITEHRAVYNMEECAELELPYPEADAKNLFQTDLVHSELFPLNFDLFIGFPQSPK